MLLTNIRKLAIAGAVIVVPLSFYGGLAIKEHFLSKEMEVTPEADHKVKERANRARIVQLEEQRKDLLKEGDDIDKKIAQLKAKMEGRNLP
ncbi:hypothetical protein A1Q2_02745 [Trichosporon asahii var. asahii CBS 8904]|uniref:Uncharacterized protein n=2 Tax=Trichosporon asahii var. asahii TaxID=189963 RepID=K1WPH4_TRIAC|nr:hypothetical protein A1Q1_07215 [Trichosporon asahii var. asahii CBS 2479]EJT51548.1 hypothetical protein A1Q1_07215 [Trichosporon asahii var. asahii CBS 2479]EKD02964.1 hypothetical protein A1Q2_02745 [Trichosporon asahii var. asahii CBS 8904]